MWLVTEHFAGLVTDPISKHQRRIGIGTFEALKVERSESARLEILNDGDSDIF